ncbi:MAG: ankyrin repeat domain-containing protein [Candidatus Cardinium sp.]|uniref:ankyrin repeat domain-containing protein n=1 Tax=Cardinium endosymbiont of Dermatophagoides farinae TaxID=2597823 RepID=UPI0011821C8D|nr:ankyrin repeat domain-containing protein [Cardinium endosymbiont of Dermatophagoides farinae]TSJ81215.1 ankyrin repeat domain-containing protein [Cardinium endosymbiont of Dermatophagoides farinae]UWW97265.1 MAG: ankyrin repeat domain-containing protein [Candidatus Cardinium sp.]
MNNIYRLPKHISHIISRYIMASIIGTPLITACSNGGPSYGMDSKEANQISSSPATKNAAVQTLDEHDNAAIHVAAERDNLDDFKRLITENPKVLETVNKYGNTPLHIAALRGHIALVKWIVEWIKNDPTSSNLLNIQNNNGHIPAHQAARKGRQEVYNLLAAAGSDLTIKCIKHGMTPPEELEKALKEALETKK